MGIIFEEAPRTSMQGNYFSASSEREFHGIATESCSKEYVYENFRDFVFDGRLYDFHGVPLAQEGIQVESDEPSGKYWTCRIRYEPKPNAQAVEEIARAATGVEFGAFPASFSTTGGTSRLYRSYGTTRYNVGGTAPNFDGLIGWNGESFDGVDIVAPKLTFAIQKRSPADALPNFAAFASMLADLVGKTNAQTFYGFSPGVVLFLGVSSGALQKYPGDETQDPFFYWDVKCEFAASPNATFKQGNVRIEKPGWDAYWTLKDKVFDPATGAILPRVVGAYVERCYERADFGWFTN